MYASPGATARPPTGAGPFAYTLGWIPDGDAGTLATLQEMDRVVRWDLSHSRDLLARELAPIVPVRGTPLEVARAIREHLARRVRFTFDPPGLELVQAASHMLRTTRPQGDCDDIAVMGATLGLAAGLPARFVVVGFTPDGPFQHVYTELETPAGWVDLDTSRDLQGVPAAFQPARRATFTVGG